MQFTVFYLDIFSSTKFVACCLYQSSIQRIFSSGLKLGSPSGKLVVINFSAETGFILNRRVFDYDLSRYAANAGAEVYTKAYVKDVQMDNGQVNGVILDYLGEEKQLQTKV